MENRLWHQTHLKCCRQRWEPAQDQFNARPPASLTQPLYVAKVVSDQQQMVKNSYMTPLCLQLWFRLQHFNRIRLHFIQRLAIISPLLCGHPSICICCSKCEFSVVSVILSHYAFTFQSCTFWYPLCAAASKEIRAGDDKKNCYLSWNSSLRFKCSYFVFRFECITLLIRATNSSVMRTVVTTKLSRAQLKGAVPLKMLHCLLMRTHTSITEWSKFKTNKKKIKERNKQNILNSPGGGDFPAWLNDYTDLTWSLIWSTC